MGSLHVSPQVWVRLWAELAQRDNATLEDDNVLCQQKLRAVSRKVGAVVFLAFSNLRRSCISQCHACTPHGQRPRAVQFARSQCNLQWGDSSRDVLAGAIESGSEIRAAFGVRKPPVEAPELALDVVHGRASGAG